MGIGLANKQMLMVRHELTIMDQLSVFNSDPVPPEVDECQGVTGLLKECWACRDMNRSQDGTQAAQISTERTRA